MSKRIMIAMLTLGAPGALGQSEESALDRFIRAREAIQTGVVQYRQRRSWDTESQRFMTNRVGGVGEVSVDYGPDAWNRVWGRQDEPAQVNYRDNQQALMRGGPSSLGGMSFQLAPVSGGAFAPPVRTRSFGATLGLANRDVNDAVLCPEDLRGAPCTYSEQESEGLIVATLQAGQQRVVYWLDPERDYNAIYIAAERDGEVKAETHITLDRFDGVWFPRRVEHYYPSWNRDGRTWSDVIDVIDAAFNRPGQPSPLTPFDAGFLPGELVESGLGQPTGELLIWTRTREAVSHDEWVRRVRAGEDKIAPALMGWNAERQTAVGRMSAWERYTYAFIARHGFDDDQRERALDVLRECQERGHRYLDRNNARIRKAELRVAESRNDSQAAEELEALLLPLDEIFEGRLKPGLERLLTAEQRRAAGPAASARGR